MHRLHGMMTAAPARERRSLSQGFDQALPPLMLEANSGTGLDRLELPQHGQAIDEERAAGTDSRRNSAATGWRAGAVRRKRAQRPRGRRPALP